MKKHCELPTHIQVSKIVLNDKDLSFSAKGFYGYLCTLPWDEGINIKLPIFEEDPTEYIFELLQKNVIHVVDGHYRLLFSKD